jgi:hypothetical protein
MNEDFYAVIKLISGEEIFSQVCSCEEKDKTILILDTPVVIETINIRQLGVSAVRVNPWLKYANDSVLVINMDRVITITEISDESIIKVYNKFLRDKDKKTSMSSVTPNMGFLSSIAEARVSLEKLYKNN